jgi:hypothetical protein
VASSTNKKVIIARFDRENLTGFVQTNSWLTPTGIEFLTQAGVVNTVAWQDLKSVYFVREFTNANPTESRKAFLNRPKFDGVWVRLQFRDGDQLEGVMPNNLLFMEPEGVHVIPPEGAQRIFVPRQAVTSVQVLGVVGIRSTKPSAKKAAREKTQIGLFEGDTPSES